MATEKETRKENKDSYVVFISGGKQYKATIGSKLIVDYLKEKKQEEEFTLDNVILYNQSGTIITGADLDKVKIKAKVVNHLKGKKVVAYKYKRRKGYHKEIGCRPLQTCIEVIDIISS